MERSYLSTPRSNYSPSLIALNEAKAQMVNSSAADKIRDTLPKLKYDPNAEYRWIWELTQNMMDSSVELKTVRGKIEYGEDYLIFSHSGSPFTLENLSYLLFQSSSKKRPDDPKQLYQDIKTSGRFGTGFILTLLLSLQIHIKGIYKNVQLGEEQYQRFEFLLDRESETKEEMMQKLELAQNFFSTLDSEDLCPVQVDYVIGKNLDTEFKYPLNQDGKAHAQKGIDIFKQMIGFVLVFNPKLTEMVLQENHNIKKTTTYKVLGRVQLSAEPEIERVQIQCGGGNSKYFIFAKDAQFAQICFEVKFDNDAEDGKYTLAKRDPKLPCLFADFPLIGSQEFGFPCVINSHHFWPDEKRQFIELVNEAFKAKTNQDVLMRAVKLYDLVLDFCINEKFKDIHLLCQIQTPTSLPYQEWYKEHILQKLIGVVSQKKIIPNANMELQCLNEVKIPELNSSVKNLSEDQQIEQLVGILQAIDNIQEKLIAKDCEFIKSWMDIMKDKCWDEIRKHCSYNFVNVISMIHECQNFGDLIQKLVIKESNSTIHFLNKVYDFLNHYDNENQKDYLEKYKLFIQQKGQICKKSGLKIDNGIDNVIKDLFRDFGYDIRNELLLKGLDNRFEMSAYGKDEITSELINCLKNSGSQMLQVRSQENIEKLALRIIQLIPHSVQEEESKLVVENKIETFNKWCMQYHPFNINQNPIKVNLDNKKIWETSRDILVKKIFETISTKEMRSLDLLSNFIQNGSTLEWLNTFYSYSLYVNTFRVQTYFPTLLNCKGIFLDQYYENKRDLKQYYNSDPKWEWIRENALLDCTSLDENVNDLDETVKNIKELYKQLVDEKIDQKLINKRFTAVFNHHHIDIPKITLAQMCTSIDEKLKEKCTTMKGFENSAEIILKIEDLYTSKVKENKERYFYHYSKERQDRLATIFSKRVQKSLLNVFINKQEKLLHLIGELNVDQLKRLTEQVEKQLEQKEEHDDSVKNPQTLITQITQDF